MSAHASRKRARTESDEPLLKQELDAEASTATVTIPGAAHPGHSMAPAPDPEAKPSHDERERNGTAPVLERDPEFWFSDGTVILVAKNVEFRFYRALLADRSPVFNAKFADQHPTRDVQFNDQHSFSCPIVHLTDSPEDLRHILRAYVSGKQTRQVLPSRRLNARPLLQLELEAERLM